MIARQVYARWDAKRGTYAVNSPYESRNIIKTTVPAPARKWDKPSKVWRIEPDWANHLFDALTRAGYDVRVTRPTPKTKPKTAPAANWVAGAFTACPQGETGKLRNSLMRVFHPDAGGDLATAKAINREADKALQTAGTTRRKKK